MRRNLDVLTTQLPQLDVTTANVILDDDELFAYLSVEINQCVRPAGRYYFASTPHAAPRRQIAHPNSAVTHPNI